MNLKEVKTKNDIETLYVENNLTSLKDKILFLRNEMGILASRGDVETEEEELLGLEELALTKIWKGLRRDKRIKYLESIKEGWLDGDGLPVKSDVIKQVRNGLDNYPDNLPEPYMYPTHDGGIFIEWYINKPYLVDVSVELNNDVIEFHRSGNDGVEEEMIMYSFEEVLKKLASIVGGNNEN